MEYTFAYKHRTGVVKVDDADNLLISKYNWLIYVIEGKSYAVTEINGNPVPMHKLLVPNSIGFVDGDTLNNQRKNLKVPLVKTSKYKGVSKYKHIHSKTFKWRASIRTNGKSKNVDFPYTDEGELLAARCYDQLALAAFGEKAKLNFPLSESPL